MLAELPILALRASFLDTLGKAPVVLSSPTGSGKSTEVPRWCPGRVLVVEPRRIACRSLAARVAELSGTRLGDDVGYVVRDERIATNATRIVFATPGMVLRSPELALGADTIVLDEFHERTLDVDLLLALLLRRETRSLVVMSATLEGERVARHVGGVHLSAEGRAFPVEVRYLEQGDALPDPSNLAARVRRAVQASSGDPGDVLVFLPGKAEIDACARALAGADGRDLGAVVPLHGGLRLEEQQRAFATSSERRIVLATNVAETSLTLPGVGVVIDAGLVRQTRYHDGRGSLALGPIAEDSAAQRAGRAGRTSPGVCYRLWSPAARLAKTTLPEIHRESLVPLLLAAAAWGTRAEDLPLLDPPKAYALAAARADLDAWGALAADGALTEGGRALFALPLDAPLARLLVEARRSDCLDDALDLVAALAVGRPMFLPGDAPQDPQEDLRLGGCDATALVRAVREGQPDVHRLSAYVVDEARRMRARLRRVHGLAEAAPRRAAFDREAVARAAIAADGRVVHVARPRGRDTFFSNGGTELELARESAVRNVRDVAALVVFDSRAFGAGREAHVRITCATTIPLSAIAKAGLGSDRLAAVHLEGKRVVATVERVYAKRVVATREETPRGEVARAAIAALFVRGSLFRDALKVTRERLALAALAAKVAARHDGASAKEPAPELDAWVLRRVTELGVESGDDLALLSPADLTAPDVPSEIRAELRRTYPLTVSVGDATYAAVYDLERGQVILRMTHGSRRDLPPLAYLPRFPGLRICVDGPRGIAVLRERG